MKKLFSSLYFQVLVFSIAAGAMLGCGSWFAKRQGEEKGQINQASAQKMLQDSLPQSNDPLSSIKTNLEKFCFFPGINNFSTRNNPYYFKYQFSDKGNCPPANAEELIRGAFLPAMGKHDSLGFLEFSNIGTAKGERYQQYYKGIKVETYTTRFNYTNDQVTSIAGTFYPNLNIDTTGMISKEEAARVVLKQRNIPDSLYNIVLPQMLRFSNFGVLPSYNKIFYAFRFYVGSDKGTWIVNAVTGQFHSYVKPDWSNVCRRCVAGNSVEVTCPPDACSSMPSTENYTENVLFEAPTLYNNCQSIRVDSCFTDDVVYYRLSPQLISPDEFVITDNDTINIFDASIEAAGSVMLQEERFCNKDSITTKNAIAASLFYGMNLAKSYFSNHQIDRKERHLIWAHMPIPENNEAQYSATDDIFLFGDGDSINFNPFVSPDVVSHEYAHSVLSHVFKINRDSVHANQPQVKAIHEGVSDIFSVLTRRHAFGAVDWTIGNQVAINPVNTFPRDLAHPENTLPPQALYYNDAANNWSSNDADIYNHAGIIVKWFYLITNGGTGIKFPTDGITVQAIGLDAAENILIAGLNKLKADETEVPTYEDFCQATTLAAHALYPPTATGECSPQLTAVRKAWQAVGLDCWTAISPPLCTTCLPTDPQSDACDQLPYIQSVQITDIATGYTVAHQGWQWNESLTQLCLVNYVMPQLTTNLTQGLQVTVVTSEPMSNL
ncbi:MAG TPA: M4 family metallopeptidase, partial [Chitinophagales bacterium]|nr:M4 family metallopeptidase [Chitinophagales bacterium]